MKSRYTEIFKITLLYDDCIIVDGSPSYSRVNLYPNEHFIIRGHAHFIITNSSLV